MAQITYTISDSNLPEFKMGFLASKPVPTDDEGNPIMSENAWIKEYGKRQFIREYKNGKHILAMQQAQLEDDLVT